MIDIKVNESKTDENTDENAENIKSSNNVKKKHYCEKCDKYVSHIWKHDKTFKHLNGKNEKPLTEKCDKCDKEFSSKSIWKHRKRCNLKVFCKLCNTFVKESHFETKLHLSRYNKVEKNVKVFLSLITE